MKRNIIDIHAHILPGVDDGARTMGEACRLLEQAIAQGAIAVIATPHGGARSSPEPQVLQELAAQVQEEISWRHPKFRIFLGQELYYHEGLLEQLAAGEVLTMAGSRYVLVEFDPAVNYSVLYRGLRSLYTGGYQPILAHMERYRCLRREENLLEVLDSGCLLQMNYRGLEGSRWHPETRWRRNQVLEGRIHFLGTDMHRTDFRPPEIDGALAWLDRHVDGKDQKRLVGGNAYRMLVEAKNRRDTNGVQANYTKG